MSAKLRFIDFFAGIRSEVSVWEWKWQDTNVSDIAR